MQRRKATQRFWAWLGLATGLMLVGLAVLMGIFLRQARLAEEAAQLQADSVTALVFQLEREFLRLRSAVTLAGLDSADTDWDALTLRHDIFLSRLDLLLTSPSVDRLREAPEYQEAVPHLQQLAAQMLPWMEAPAQHRPGWAALAQTMDAMGPEVQALSFASNALISRQMQQQIRTVQGQSQMIVGLFVAQALLLLSVAATIVVRQRRQERERLALEALNRELEISRQLAEQANVTKSHFLANMSHELRTPFNGMLGMLQLLHETPLDARQRDFLHTAADSAQHLLTLLNDILDMAAIEEGKLKVAPEAIDLPRVLRDVVTPMGAQARDKGLQFEVSMTPSLPAAVRLDPTRTRQVLFNLLSNAIKFTERGSVGFEVDVQPGPTADSIELVFTVRDTGIGMSAASVERLFERFFQVESRLNRRRGGSGLGLNISRALAELMGGSLQVESREGQGSTFTLRLPTTVEASAAPCFANTSPPPLSQPMPQPASVEAQSPAAPPSAAAAEPVDATTLKVLVVDDHPINLKLATALLQKMGHEVHQATNGLQALERVRSEAFDLVLMDLHMPEMDGLESTQHIRALPAPRGQVPVVVLTANALEEARQDADDAGANAFLTKPLRVQELLAVVRNCQAAPHRRLDHDQQRPEPLSVG
jgi:signal transduction histidine kinase/ActR/RegA family two-component response regulator